MSEFPASATPAPVLVAIGDVSCTAAQVLTPVGAFPLAGTQWTIADMSQTARELPTWAIVMAISSRAQVLDLHARVSYARALSAQASH